MVFSQEKKKHKCHKCDKSLSSSVSLQRHMALHTTEKSHCCIECNKSFTKSGSLKTHMLAHHGKKPHKCVKCNNSLSSAGALKKHMKLHTQEHPHECNKCHRYFSQSANLKEHMKTHLLISKATEDDDFLTQLPTELIVKVILYLDTASSVVLGLSCQRLLQVVAMTTVFEGVLRRSRMGRMDEEEVLMLMDSLVSYLKLVDDPEPLVSSLQTTICAQFPAKTWNSVKVIINQGMGQEQEPARGAVMVSTDGLQLLARLRPVSVKLSLQEVNIESFLGVNISHGLPHLGGRLLCLLSLLVCQQDCSLTRLTVSTVKVNTEEEGEALEALVAHSQVWKIGKLHMQARLTADSFASH